MLLEELPGKTFSGGVQGEMQVKGKQLGFIGMDLIAFRSAKLTLTDPDQSRARICHRVLLVVSRTN